MPLEVRHTDITGEVERLYPDKVNARLSINSAAEFTLVFSNKFGKHTDSIMVLDDIEVQEVP
jgi:hypothetical protein